MTYLGINDYKIGPPPNWQDSKYWKRKIIGKKFRHKKYIEDVETYMVAAHERHWSDIERLDELSQERGESAERMEKEIIAMFVHLNSVCTQVEKWADSWRLTKSEYNDKWV